MTEQGDHIIHATTGSPGQATGHAIYIEMEAGDGSHPSPTSIQQLEQIHSDDIPIVPTYHPKMYDYLKNAGGLIVYDEDRITGRGATVARECGLPAVIDCPEVRSEIRTGDIVTVQGDEGIIIRQSESEA